MKTFNKVFVERMRYFRQIRGMRQADLAEAIGKTVGAIAQIETFVCGMSAETMDQIIKAFNVTPSEFFNDPLEEPKSPQKTGQDKIWDALQAISSSVVKRDIVLLLASLNDTEVAAHLARLRSELRVGQAVGAKNSKKRVTVS